MIISNQNNKYLRIEYSGRFAPIVWIPIIDCPNFSKWLSEFGVSVLQVRKLINFDLQ